MYQSKFSKFVEDELERLLNGNEKALQRYRNCMSAIQKVMSDPLSREFAKTLPDNFKAVDVLQQYRLFFKIINNPLGDGDDVVFFAWINNEDSIHQSGAVSDSYAVFRDLFHKKEIETYIPVRDEKVKEFYDRQDPWDSASVYVSIKRINQDTKGHSGAYSTLFLSMITPKDFKIDSITVTITGEGLASALLKNLCKEADRDGVSLCYELQKNVTHYGVSRHLLEKFQFRWDEDDDGMELWVRTPHH